MRRVLQRVAASISKDGVVATFAKATSRIRRRVSGSVLGNFMVRCPPRQGWPLSLRVGAI